MNSTIAHATTNHEMLMTGSATTLADGVTALADDLATLATAIERGGLVDASIGRSLRRLQARAEFMAGEIAAFEDEAGLDGTRAEELEGRVERLADRVHEWVSAPASETVQ